MAPRVWGYGGDGGSGAEEVLAGQVEAGRGHGEGLGADFACPTALGRARNWSRAIRAEHRPSRPGRKRDVHRRRRGQERRSPEAPSATPTFWPLPGRGQEPRICSRLPAGVRKFPWGIGPQPITWECSQPRDRAILL